MEPLNLQFKEVFNKSSNKQEKLPAIHRFFMEDRQCVSYVGPSVSILTKSSIDYQASLEEYQERLNFIRDDLIWLLSLPYQKFWCQMIFDETAQQMVDSYLRLSPRPYDILKLKQLPLNVRETHNSIHRYVFLVCLRMSTYRESKENFISSDAFADIIYNNFLFDIPKILDICVLYKKNPILKKMIENLFNSQKKYFQDFKICIRDIIKSMEMSKRKLRNLFDLDGYSLNFKDSNKETDNIGDRIKSNFKDIFEIEYFLRDSLISLNDLISFQSNIAQFLIDEKFDENIKDIMETTLFSIDDILKRTLNQNKNDSDLNDCIDLIKSNLKSLKYEFGKLFNQMLINCYVTPIMESIDNSNEKTQSWVDNFVRVCHDFLEYGKFLSYFEEKFYLSEQIDLIYQVNKIDESQYNYLMENFKLIILTYCKNETVKSRFTKEKKSKQHFYDNDSVTPKASSTTKDSGTDDRGKNMNTLVQSVLDLFPDQDKIFIEKCIRYFDFNVEQVINAFLENNLPNFDKDLDQEHYEANVEETVVDKFTELNLRKNVYDGDQFDIFKSAKVDTTNIHQGKKNKTDSFDVDNKQDINREFFANYDHIMYARENEMEYEDEYDDTYDENTTVNDDFEIKPLNKKMEMSKREMFEIDEEEDEENLNERVDNTFKNISGAEAVSGINKFQNNQKTASFNPKQTSHDQQDHQYQKKPGFYQQKQEASKIYSTQKYKDKKIEEIDKNERNEPTSKNQPSNLIKQESMNNSQRNQQAPQPQRQRHQHQQNQATRNYDALPQRQNQQNRNQQSARNNETKKEEKEQVEDQHKINSSQPKPQKNENSTEKTYDEVKRERRWKNDNKAKVVHHNRKELAAKKMNQF